MRQPDSEERSRLDAKADGIADRRCGTRPRQRPLHLAIATYVLVAVAPWLVLSALGTVHDLDVALVIGGLLAAIAVYAWQRRRHDRWRAAQRAAFEALMAEAREDVPSRN